jgi:hypothetical protein
MPEVLKAEDKAPSPRLLLLLIFPCSVGNLPTCFHSPLALWGQVTVPLLGWALLHLLEKVGSFFLLASSELFHGLGP